MLPEGIYQLMGWASLMIAWLFWFAPRSVLPKEHRFIRYGWVLAGLSLGASVLLIYALTHGDIRHSEFIGYAQFAGAIVWVVVVGIEGWRRLSHRKRGDRG